MTRFFFCLHAALTIFAILAGLIHSAAADNAKKPALTSRRPTLFIIGDSTVKNSTKGQSGWGDPFATFFDPAKIKVENRALGGRSSRTFHTEGLWAQVVAALKPGDFVLIQFGHNDSGPLTEGRARASLKGAGDETREVTSARTGKPEVVRSYGAYLRQYIADAKAKGATPIVLSPVPRNIWKDDNALVRASSDYGKWAAEAARAEGALFIDLNELVARTYEAAGRDRVNALFGGDHTHTNAAGAELTAAELAKAIRELKECPLQSFLATGGTPGVFDGRGEQTSVSSPRPSKTQGVPPSDWMEQTGHRVIRLSQEPGSSNLYFHQNASTADGDKMIITTPSGLAAVNLRTRAIETIVEGRAEKVIVGRKTRQVYYFKGDSVFATHLDTRATREIAKLPSEFRRGTGLAVNADETLLAGSCPDVTRIAAAPRPMAEFLPELRSFIRRPSLEARWAARLPMKLYTIDIQNGETKTIHASAEWLNHVQFSPTDPTLIMFCHEGPWHKVDRIWTIRSDGTALQKIHTRTMQMEIAGHEFFSPDGKIIWYDLQTPKSQVFQLAGHVLATGEKIQYQVKREHWSVHFNASPDGKLFAGDGGGPRSVAAPGNGQWIYLFTPQNGSLAAERLVDLSKHDYRLEPNVAFTSDGEWIVFRSNLHGPTHVYAVEVKRKN